MVRLNIIIFFGKGQIGVLGQISSCPLKISCNFKETKIFWLALFWLSQPVFTKMATSYKMIVSHFNRLSSLLGRPSFPIFQPTASNFYPFFLHYKTCVKTSSTIRANKYADEKNAFETEAPLDFVVNPAIWMHLRGDIESGVPSRVQRPTKDKPFNKNKIQMRKITLLLLLVAVTFTQDSDRTFCWRDSYTRGAGVILSRCAPTRDRIGMLCYTKCPAGFRRVGFDCHEVCPNGLVDQGLFCRRMEYGRGAGYPWRFGDGFNDNGMIRRCEADHGRGNCEKDGLIYYPKCRPGFIKFGCCICRPFSFRCSQFGMDNGFQADLSCGKRIRVGDPVPMTCAPGLEQNGLLCYPQCRRTYKGVGPVCWGQPPRNWVECGMGAAISDRQCASMIANQVFSVFNMAFSLATLGAGGQATALAKDAALAPELVKDLKEGFTKLKDLYNKNKDVVDFFKKAAKVKQTATAANNVLNLFTQSDPTPADIIRVTAEIVSLFDPTGISGVVAAFSYPKCTDIRV